MAKYDGLTQRLESVSADSVTLSFDELDALVDGLPASAREHRPWWGNARDSLGQAKSWMGAGWRVDAVDLVAEKVAFRRSVAEDDADVAVRRPFLMRTLFDVLDEASQPLKAGEALALVADRAQLTEVELSTNNSGAQRYDTFLRFVSAWAAKIGWISKADGWSITDTGREAVASLPDDELYPHLTKLYRSALATEKKNSAWLSDPKTAAVAEALSVLDAGEWATYGDVGELSGLSPQMVGRFVNTVATPQGHRLLLIDGRCGADFAWAEPRAESQRDILEAEGLEFSESAVADERAQVRLEDLRDRLEAAGLAKPAQRRAWLVRGNSVNGKDLVPTWLSEERVSLAATNLREVAPGVTRDELKPIVDEDYAHASYAAKAEKLDEFHAFLSRMQAGHLVATVSQGRLHLGRIVGPAIYQNSADGDSNLVRDVEWAGGVDGIDYGDLPGDVAARLRVQRDVLDLTQQLETLEGLLTAETTLAPPPRVETVTLRDATPELATRLHVDRGWLQECIDLLNDRPQLIFYGPPGTGKTYIAQDLAKHVAGDNVRLVQFHPSYSYEDFFEGFRPTPEGGFALKPGPMRRVVDQAVANPNVPHVLIIDEINRGNLAKVFGELYFLLEYRDSNVELLYADDDFSLPPNVYIIGTMNTADRSIALVDTAMRRRFAFLALHPSEKPTSGILRSWLKAEGMPTRVADLLDELNARIADPDFKVGPSYFMRGAVHEGNGLDRTWRTSILPLLEEHHYGELTGAEVAAKYGLAAIVARVDRAPEIPLVEDADDAPPAAD